MAPSDMDHHRIAAAGLQPQLQPEPMPEVQPGRRRESGGWGGLSQGAKIGLGVGGLLLLGALAAGVISLSKPDDSTPAATNQTRPVAAAPSTRDSSSMFQPVAPGEIDQAIAILIMPEAQKAQVRQALSKQTLKIAWMHLSDSEAEDGDWVSVAAGGFNQSVRLFKDPLRVAVPYVPGVPIAVTGQIDGDGNGITVAVHSGASTFRLKYLVRGETIQVPTP
jgi:hypothetical protein